MTANGKWWDIDLSDKELSNLKKRICLALKIFIIIGWILFASLSVFLFTSVGGVKFDSKGFEQQNLNNETISIEGEIIVDNTHWYSVDITELNICISIFTDDDIRILNKEIYKDKIARLKKSSIDIDLEFELDDMGIEDFESLRDTKSVTIEISIGFRYAYLLGFYTEIKTEEEVN